MCFYFRYGHTFSLFAHGIKKDYSHVLTRECKYGISYAYPLDLEAYMGVVYCRNPRNGIVYVYSSFSYWDKETKSKKAIRKLIGCIWP